MKRGVSHLAPCVQVLDYKISEIGICLMLPHVLNERAEILKTPVGSCEEAQPALEAISSEALNESDRFQVEAGIHSR